MLEKKVRSHGQFWNRIYFFCFPLLTILPCQHLLFVKYHHPQRLLSISFCLTPSIFGGSWRGSLNCVWLFLSPWTALPFYSNVYAIRFNFDFVAVRLSENRINTTMLVHTANPALLTWEVKANKHIWMYANSFVNTERSISNKVRGKKKKKMYGCLYNKLYKNLKFHTEQKEICSCYMKYWVLWKKKKKSFK